MITVLCYGDSNTWGYEPGTARRLPREVRWPGVARAALGPRFELVEEGLNARTTVLDDPTRPGRSGLTYLRPCLESHAPLDLVVLMLGTNDLKHRFGLGAYDIAANAAMLIATVQQTPCGVGGVAPPVLLVSPPAIGELSNLADLFAGAGPKSRELARHYRAFAEQAGCRFLDAATVAEADPADGVHLGPAGHAALGRAIAAAIRDILGG
ncbi:MAG: SGNH/GDSL hydrolase family protein [Gemmataceae bacterium]|nr:SGNH/GDSL hydrolase family protein [Gemmataceae bacterium]